MTKGALTLILAILAFACPNGAVLTADELEVTQDQFLSSKAVWLPEVEELEWAEVQPGQIDKPWLEADYSTRDYVVARGIAGATTSEAIEDVILPRLKKRLHLENDRQRRAAVRRIQKELKRTPIVVDRFEQTFFKQVGEERIEAFTREALLLDVSHGNLARLVRPVHRDLHRRERVRSGTLTAATVTIGIVCFVCWIGSRFFNRITQGYYVWLIRLVTAAVLLGSFALAAGMTFSILRAL